MEIGIGRRATAGPAATPRGDPSGPDPPTFFWTGRDIRVNPLIFLLGGGELGLPSTVETLAKNF